MTSCSLNEDCTLDRSTNVSNGNYFWGFYSMLMAGYGGLLYRAYPEYYADTAFEDVNAVKYWTLFSYY
jgi:hypothetical protein